MTVEQTLDPVVTMRGHVPPDDVEYARTKLGRIPRIASTPVLRLSARLTLEPDPARVRPAVAEATVDLNGAVLRAQVAADTMREAVDLLDGRLRRRIDEHDSRRRALVMRHRDDGPGEWRHGSVQSERPHRYARPVEEREVVRHKTFAVEPCTIDEAVFDLEALDHDFYLFREVSSDADCVLWRLDGHYALVHAGGEAPVLDGCVAEVEVRAAPPLHGELDDAVELLELGDDPFVFFTALETGRGHVVYRRFDGHYGLIVPADEAGI